MANGYIRLKIAKTAAYNGRVLVPDEELTVDAQIADKLVERKLAEVISEESELGTDNEPENTNIDEMAELDNMKVEELKEYAQEAGIDLKGAIKKADILAAIKEAM